MPFDEAIFHYTEFVLDDMYQYLINVSTGSARDNLSQEKIRELDIVIPAKQTIDQFSTIMLPFYRKIEINLQQNEQLASVRDWLLPMLMNGQVTVGEVLDRSEENSKEQVDTIGQEGTQMHLFA